MRGACSGPLQSGAFLRQAPAGIGPVAAPLSVPIPMADVQISADAHAVLLHHSTT